MLWMNLAPRQQPAATAAVVEDKSYAVTPASVKVKAGFVAGEVVDMKITERVERGSDRVVTQAKLTGILPAEEHLHEPDRAARRRQDPVRRRPGAARSSSEDARSEPTVKFSSSSNLDPGQETTESMDVEFPAEALKAARLKEIRVDLAYSPHRTRGDASHPVSIGGRPLIVLARMATTGIYLLRGASRELQQKPFPSHAAPVGGLIGGVAGAGPVACRESADRMIRRHRPGPG